MSSFISAAPVASGQVQSLDSVRGHSLPSDAIIIASSSQVNPANQNTGSYALIESANALTLTTTGSVPVVTQSPFADLYKEGSIYFNGTVGNYISGTATGLMGTQWNTTGLTVEAWVNYPTFTGAGAVPIAGVSNPYLVGQFQPAGSSYNWAFGSNTLGYVTFFYWNGASQNITSSVPLSTNTWNHIAFSCLPGGATANVYVNGTQVATTSISGTPVVSSSIPLTLGQFNSGSPNLNCYVADVRITTGAALYTGASFTVPSAPLSTAATGVTQALIRAGQNSPTVQNGALTFDRGLKQFQNYGPQTFNIVTQGFTAIWRGAFTGTAGNFEPIFQAGSTTAGYSNGTIALIRSGAGQTIYFVLWPSNSTTAVGQVNSSVNLTQGTTYIIAARYNPVTQLADIWINGVPGTPATITTASLVGDRTVTAYTGQAVYGGSFTSMTSNVLAIYNRALSNVEIYNSYLALNTVPATPQQKTLEIGDINGTPALSVAGDGKVSVQSIGLSSNVVPWPPAAMTGYDTVINGGVYKARASSEYDANNRAWYAFDKSASTSWATTGTYSSSNPYSYTGTVTTTDVNGTVYPGEWLQIQLPVQIALSSYSFQNFADATKGLAKWVVLGSRDGITWTLVDSRAGQTYSASTLTFSTSSQTNAFVFYRLVINQCTGGSTIVALYELTLYGTADTSPTLTIAPATVFNTSVATPALTGIAGSGVYVPQDFSSSGLNIPAYVVSNTATTANTVQYSSFGPFAGEGSFQFGGGKGGYIAFPSGTPPNFNLSSTSVCTFEFWFYPTWASGTSTEIISHASPTSGSYDWTLYTDGANKLGYYNGTTGFVSTNGINFNTWNHGSFSFTGGTLYIGLNGTVNSASFGTPAYTSTYPLSIGSFVGAGANFNGYLSGVRIVSGQALYTTTFTPPTGPLQPIQGTTQAGLPYGTVLLLRNAPAPGRIQTTKFSGANSGTVLSFPPAAMTTYATTLNAGYGQGTYVASASSEYTGLLAWQAFDKTTATGWGSNGTTELYNSSGFYVGTAGTVTVDVAGNSYAGAWLQVQLASPIVLSSYQLSPSTVTPGSQSPARFWILGSRDGTNWSLVDSRTGVTSYTALAYTSFSVTSGQAFTYFRIVANQLNGYNAGAPVFVLTEFILNGSIESVNVTADGRVGLGVVNPTRALEVAGDIVCTGTVSSQSTTFRNVLYNGDFRINQRGISTNTASPTAMGTSSTAYALDRWLCYRGSYAAGGYVAQGTLTSVDIPYQNDGLVNFLRVGLFIGNTSTQAINVVNALETKDSIRLAGKTVTMSFYYRTGAALAGNFQPVIATSTGTDQNYSAAWAGSVVQSPPVLPASTSWTKYSFSAQVPVTATQVAAYVQYYPTTNPSVANDYLDITGVQLEKGTVATPFEVRPYATELALCQRYYEKSYDDITAPGTNADIGLCSGVAGDTAGIQGPVFKVTKRYPPTMTFWSKNGTVNNISGWTATGTNTSQTSYGGVGQNSCRYISATVTNGAIYTYHWSAAAEL